MGTQKVYLASAINKNLCLQFGKINLTQEWGTITLPTTYKQNHIFAIGQPDGATTYNWQATKNLTLTSFQSYQNVLTWWISLGY